jgi:hypothetical protein
MIVFSTSLKMIVFSINIRTLWSPVFRLHKNDHFTKTGSGQTQQGKALKRERSCGVLLRQDIAFFDGMTVGQLTSRIGQVKTHLFSSAFPIFVPSLPW